MNKSPEVSILAAIAIVSNNLLNNVGDILAEVNTPILRQNDSPCLSVIQFKK